MSSSEDYSSDEEVSTKTAKSTKPKKQSSQKVEDIYKKTNLREHILNRPDSYIGTLERESDRIFLINSSNDKFEQRTISYVPGLFKIFDEILVNASDNKQRDPRGMTELRVDVDQARNTISVYNNGQGIPISIHKEYQIYVPELIFGQLLTSSNYDDSQKRTVGGRNGFGAKLTNIFSTTFLVETCDGKQTYSQLFRNNMSDKGEPKITKTPGTDSFTRITFSPDLARFNMTELEDDIVALVKKRTYDIAGTCGKGLKVYYNKRVVGIKDFKSFCEMHLSQPADLIYEVINDRWEVGIAPSDGNATQVSFVNRISTLRGGNHVNAITEQCIKLLTEAVTKKNKKSNLKPQHFKNHIWVFVNCLVENPKFDTQTKVNLTSTKSTFGSNPQLSEAFLKKVSKSSILASILSFAQFQESKALKKTDAKKKTSRLMGIAKLEDANKAGTAQSSKCTLIITEGDSAKALAMSGLSVVGRDYYGVFPLRGKMLNVRDASSTQIIDNTEITHLKQIIGLQQNKVYTDRSSLRYGHIMIMTDQDHDGSHIKGLIINMFAHFWPSLLKTEGFLTEFITPIVKVSKSKNVGSARDAKSFYTLPEFEQWRDSHNSGKGFNTKYYKGLGTSTSAEAKVYFSNIDSHQIPFHYKDDKCLKLIEMVFSKSTADERKNWLGTFTPGIYLNHDVNRIAYQDFINKELILFSVASNLRAIPCLVDGLKPGQRKVLFACFKRKLTKELKVAQLAGYVAEQSAYHHGEQSLAQTIVTLAQNFVGSNNINYLWPSGQFGTRAGGGKDAASTRYIFTYLSPVTRVLFNTADDPLLNYLNDDGQPIEPEFYVPVIPTVLVNGSSGIGTGWSTDIPNHNPRDLIANIRRMLNDEEPYEMHPWYKGFIGQLVQRMGRRGCYAHRGLFDVIAEKPNTVHIYELPIGEWTSGYKQWLETLAVQGHITELSEYHTDVTVSFLVSFSDEHWKKLHAGKDGLRGGLKLESTLAQTNMVLFNSQGQLHRYENTTEILKEFYPIRYALYEKRKEYIIGVLSAELNKIDNKVRFIQYVIEEKIKLRNIKRADLLKCLEDYKFDPSTALDKISTPESLTSDGRPQDDNDSGSGSDDDDDADDDNVASSKKKPAKKSTDAISERLKGYNYLTSMPLLSLTYEKVQELLKDKKNKEDELSAIKRKSVKNLWEYDLDQLEIVIQDHEDKEVAELRAGENAKYKTGSGRLGNSKKSNYVESDHDDDDDGSDSDDWGKSKKKKAPVAKKGAAGKKEAIPDYVLKVLQSRPKSQSLCVEEETEAEKKKRLKQEKAAASKLADVADLLGLDSSVMGDSFGDTPVQKTTSKRATKTTSMNDNDDKPKRKKSVMTDDDDDETDFDDGSDSDAPKKTTKKAPAAAKKAPAPRSKKAAADSDDEKPAKGKKAAPAAATATTTTTTTTAKKAPTARGKKQNVDSENDFLGSTSDSESTEPGFDDSEDEDEDAPRKATKRKSPPATRPARTVSRQVIVESSDGGDGSDSDSDSGDGSGDESDTEDDQPAPKHQPVKKARSKMYSDDEEESRAPKVARKTSSTKVAPAASKTKKVSPKSTQMYDNNDDDDHVSIAPVAPQPTGLAAKLLAKTDSKVASKNILSMFSSASSSMPSSQPLTSAPTRKLTLDSDSDDDVGAKVVAKAKPPKQESAQLQAMKSRFSLNDDDSDSDFTFGGKATSSTLTSTTSSLTTSSLVYKSSSLLGTSSSSSSLLKSKFALDDSD